LALHLVGAREELFEEGPGKLLAFDDVPQSRTYGHQRLLSDLAGSGLKDSSRAPGAPSGKVYQLP
jgi:hypothetical protein